MEELENLSKTLLAKLDKEIQATLSSDKLAQLLNVAERVKAAQSIQQEFMEQINSNGLAHISRADRETATRKFEEELKEVIKRRD